MHRIKKGRRRIIEASLNSELSSPLKTLIKTLIPHPSTVIQTRFLSYFHKFLNFKCHLPGLLASSLHFFLVLLFTLSHKSFTLAPHQKQQKIFLRIQMHSSKRTCTFFITTIVHTWKTLS